ncbi:tigger transposable element-derived protein 4 [Bemisia tabaci]|uniref:tigger transposable element-derived protein 4 n=1 Tax=Bemisia tabaci TaxID=7038 RepID=UPI003B28705F
MEKERNRKQIAVKEKFEILKFLEENKSISHKEVAAKYGIGVSTIRQLLKRKDRLIKLAKEHHNADDKKRFKKSKYERIEKALLNWFDHATANGIKVYESMFKEKATEIAQQLQFSDFRSSNGWFYRFKTRYNITPNYTPNKKSFKSGDGSQWKTDVSAEILADYRLADIYCADIFGLSSVAVMGKQYVERDGAINSNDQFSILLCSSIDGSHRDKPVVFGKNELLNKNQTLPYAYVLNISSWMTKEEFYKWIIEFDTRISAERRKAALFLGNSLARFDFPNVDHVKIFLAPSCSTSCLLPIYNIVLKATEQSFKEATAYWLENLCLSKTTVTKALVREHFRQMLSLFANHWEEVESASFLRSFQESGFCPNATSHTAPDLSTGEIEHRSCSPTASPIEISEESDNLDDEDGIDILENISDQEIDDLILLIENKTDNPVNNSEEMSESTIAAGELIEELEEEVPCVSTEEALASIATLKNFMAQTGSFNDKHWDYLAELQNIILDGQEQS